MGLALVTRIPNLQEAHIAAGALRSGGIRAEVFDASFGGMEAPVIEGLGGYRIMAPEEQVAEARLTLRALRANPPARAPEDGAPWSQPLPTSRMRSLGMRVVALAFLGAPVVVWLIFTLIH
ncbi:MAG TPA: DUF2007 domain-containing protein [Caulobacteraceae bacterium]|nr:DUF2007 domain-containing protein [Caulobacteraceae bacterium]